MAVTRRGVKEWKKAERAIKAGGAREKSRKKGRERGVKGARAGTITRR